MTDQDYINAGIELAEAMGWRWKPFDPFIDANDCEALIDWLNEQGYGLTIEPWANGHSVAI